MIVKPLFACVMVLFFTMMPVYAQDQPQGDEKHQPPSADDIVSRMQTKLNLTQDQLTAITPIIEKYSSKREELHQSMEDGTADKESIHSQMKQLRADEGQELSKVLTADQMSQWDSMQAQGRRKHSDGVSNNEGPSEPAS
jgi:Spy/CpxP family protein refolding chaperone